MNEWHNGFVLLTLLKKFFQSFFLHDEKIFLMSIAVIDDGSHTVMFPTPEVYKDSFDHWVLRQSLMTIHSCLDPRWRSPSPNQKDKWMIQMDLSDSQRYGPLPLNGMLAIYKRWRRREGNDVFFARGEEKSDHAYWDPICFSFEPFSE